MIILYFVKINVIYIDVCLVSISYIFKKDILDIYLYEIYLGDWIYWKDIKKG